MAALYGGDNSPENTAPLYGAGILRRMPIKSKSLLPCLLLKEQVRFPDLSVLLDACIAHKITLLEQQRCYDVPQLFLLEMYGVGIQFTYSQCFTRFQQTLYQLFIF